MQQQLRNSQQHFLVHMPHEFICLFLIQAQFHHCLVPCNIRRRISVIKGKYAFSNIGSFLKHALKQGIRSVSELYVKILSICLDDHFFASCHRQAINKLHHFAIPSNQPQIVSKANFPFPTLQWFCTLSFSVKSRKVRLFTLTNISISLPIIW